MTQRNDKQALATATTRVLTILGLGLVLSVVAGLLIGWITGNVAGAVGRTVAIGMGITSVLGVLLLLLPSRR